MSEQQTLAVSDRSVTLECRWRRYGSLLLILRCVSQVPLFDPLFIRGGKVDGCTAVVAFVQSMP